MEEYLMKHRLLTFSIVVALFFALAIPAFAASKTLGVSEIDQNKTEWCWAACSEMIGKYYDSGSNRDQYDLVEYIKGNTGPMSILWTKKVEILC